MKRDINKWETKNRFKIYNNFPSYYKSCFLSEINNYLVYNIVIL